MFEIECEQRVVTMQRDGETLAFSVPPIAGEITGAELKGEFVVVHTRAGRVSFHADERAHVRNLTWRELHPVRGRIHWHSLTKLLRARLLHPLVARRIRPRVTNYRFRSGARSPRSSRAWITLDGDTIWDTGDSDVDFEAYELGEALTQLLWCVPTAALSSTNLVVASLGVLSRHLLSEDLHVARPGLFDSALWRRCYELRHTIEAGSDPGGSGISST